MKERAGETNESPSPSSSLIERLGEDQHFQHGTPRRVMHAWLEVVRLPWLEVMWDHEASVFQ